MPAVRGRKRDPGITARERRDLNIRNKQGREEEWVEGAVQ